VWFPWNPLVTFYREHRFDHTVVGLYVRLLAGQFPPTAQLRRHLPPEWSSIALGPKGSDWGLAVDLLPQPRTSVQRGMWTIYQAPPKR
jgi:hypothetical protein